MCHNECKSASGLPRLSSQVQHMGDEFVWREEAEAFSRPVVNQLQNGIHLLIGNLGEISPSREEKAEQSINIFILESGYPL